MTRLASIDDLEVLQRELCTNPLQLPRHNRHAIVAQRELDAAPRCQCARDGDINRRITHAAVIVLFHPETGEPLAIMDGRLITEMRTAAVSAVATKAMA